MATAANTKSKEGDWITEMGFLCYGMIIPIHSSMNDATRKNCFIEILPEVKTSLKEAQHELFGQELEE